MKLLKGFITEDAAKAKSMALFLGPPENLRSPQDVTKYLCGWIKNETTNEWALSVDTEVEKKLPVVDKGQLVTDDWPKPKVTVGGVVK